MICRVLNGNKWSRCLLGQLLWNMVKINCNFIKNYMHQIPSRNSSKRIISTNQVLKPFARKLLLSHNSRIILHINVNINCSAVNYIEIFILSNVNVCWKVPSFYITVTTLWITHDSGLNFYLWLPSVTVGSMVMFSSGLKKGRREPYHMLTSVSLWKPAHVIKYDGKGLSGWTKKKNMFCFCLLEEQDREDGFCSNLQPLLWRSCIFWCGTEIQSRMVGVSVSGPQKLDPLNTSCSFCCCTTNSTNRSKKV